MSKQEELRAAQLFDEYLVRALTGHAPDKQILLEQCPRNQVDNLHLAMEGIDFVIANYCQAQIKPGLTKAFLTEIRTDKERHRRLEEFCRNFPSPSHIRVQELVSEMTDYLNRTASPGPTAKSVTLTGQAAVAGVFNRKTGSGSAPMSFRPDPLWLRHAEARISLIAETTLKRIGIDSAPIGLEYVSKFLHLFVLEMGLENADGYLITDHEVGAILLNSNMEYLRRRRYTWAHEIGHFLLHKGIPVFRDKFSDNTDPFHNKEETEADMFASFLLMPTFLLPGDFATLLPSFERADGIVNRFDVSLTAAFWRMIRASKRRCAFVVTLNGAYKWHVPSPSFYGFVRPTEDTLAAQMAEGKGLAEDGWSFSAEAWVEGGIAREGVQIHEQSRRTQSGHVYTLLTAVE